MGNMLYHHTGKKYFEFLYGDQVKLKLISNIGKYLNKTGVNKKMVTL